MLRKNTNTDEYEVLIDFTDAKDSSTIYRAGKDKYPREGYSPSSDRISYLQSNYNTLGKAVIAKQ